MMDFHSGRRRHRHLRHDTTPYHTIQIRYTSLRASTEASLVYRTGPKNKKIEKKEKDKKIKTKTGVLGRLVCIPVIPPVPSDSTALISSLLRLSAHHLALTASASQPLKSATLSLHLSVPVPVRMPFLVTSRPTTASIPSNPLNPSPVAPQIWLC